MATTTPIYTIAKNLNIDSNKVLLACNTLGITAKAASKRLNDDEAKMVIEYFKAGKDVSTETIDIGKIDNKNHAQAKMKIKRNQKKQITFFPNRLIG